MQSYYMIDITVCILLKWIMIVTIWSFEITTAATVLVTAQRDNVVKIAATVE